MNNQSHMVGSPVTETWAGLRADGVTTMDRTA
jgi:hypothetical protein